MPTNCVGVNSIVGYLAQYDKFQIANR